jgi:hypothetical protein
VARYRTLIECAEKTRFANQVSLDNPASPIYRLLGTAVVFSNEPIHDPHFEQVQNSLQIRVDPMPRTFLIHDVRLATDTTEVRAHLADPRFDPTSVAWLESSAGPLPPLALPTAPEATRIVTYRPERVRIQVDASAPGLLVLTDTYYPGWRARLNGASAKIYPVDYALRGVAVPAGKSLVEFEYQPAWFWPGVTLGVIGLLGATWTLGLRRRKLL